MNFLHTSTPKIIQVLQTQGYKIYTQPYELNIIGVRSSQTIYNKFDDVIHVCLMTKNGQWLQHIFECTTDPSPYFLAHPINQQGTALLKQGQYIHAYQLGLHRGKYKALVQRKPITVYRSKNANTDINTKLNHTQTGYFGINIHHAKGNGTTEDVNRWSAGCQVIANIDDFKTLIQLAEQHAQLYGNHFTYTLLDYRQYLEPKTNEYKHSITSNNKTNEPLTLSTQPNYALPIVASLTALIGIGGWYYWKRGTP